jgi:glycosyltransferase involved in cell wall biosynthesis
MPAVEKAYPGAFEWIVTGGKLPERVAIGLPPYARYLGYVDNLDAVLMDVDGVIAPRVAGYGMQLKVFEPLCRGIPVVTSESVLGGYPFKDEEALLLAEDANEFVRACGKLQNIAYRRKLGENARMLALSLFAKKQSLAILRRACESIGAL